VTTGSFLHQIIVQTGGELDRVWELERRLREHGYLPVRESITSESMTITWIADRNIDLDFLRPDFLA
jgi:hypothetical protein